MSLTKATENIQMKGEYVMDVDKQLIMIKCSNVNIYWDKQQ